MGWRKRSSVLSTLYFLHKTQSSANFAVLPFDGYSPWSASGVQLGTHETRRSREHATEPLKQKAGVVISGRAWLLRLTLWRLHSAAS